MKAHSAQAANCTTQDHLLWWFMNGDKTAPGRFAFMVCFEHEMGKDLEDIHTFSQSPIRHWLRDPLWRDWLINQLATSWHPKAFTDYTIKRLGEIPQSHAWEVAHTLYGWRTLARLWPGQVQPFPADWEAYYQHLCNRFRRS